jgi:ABC-type enterochelin transport system ATPase subunit
MFLEDKLRYLDSIEVPAKYVDYEFIRLKYRLKQIGYTYKEYLSTSQMTDKDVREYCAIVARENYIAMLVCQNLDYEITNEDLKAYYGDNLDYVVSVQGEPYLRLNLMRDLAIYAISDQVTVVIDSTNT